jgi:hypothetical protein
MLPTSESEIRDIVYQVCVHAIAHRHSDVTGVATQVFAAHNLAAAKREGIGYTEGRDCN